MFDLGITKSLFGVLNEMKLPTKRIIESRFAVLHDVSQSEPAGHMRGHGRVAGILPWLQRRRHQLFFAHGHHPVIWDIL
jgi:hypothetical protein